MKAVIFGRFGFLGSALAKRIEHSDKDGIYINCMARVSGIVGNMATPALMLRDNLQAAITVFDQAVENKIKRMVNFGSTCSYSPDASTPFSPDDFLKGEPEKTNSAYAAAKRTIYLMSRAYAEQYGMDNLYLVMPNLYGPGDQSDHVIPSLIRKIRKAIEDKSEKVVLYGSGKAEREFLFIDDAVELIGMALEFFKRPEPIHLTSGQMITIWDLAYLLKNLMGFRGDFEWDASFPDGQLKRQLKTGLQLKVMTSLEEGLRRTLDKQR